MPALTPGVFSISNGQATGLNNITAMTPEDFLECVVEAVGHGLRISALFAQPVENGRTRLWAILSHDSRSLILPFYSDLQSETILLLRPIARRRTCSSARYSSSGGLGPRVTHGSSRYVFNGPSGETPVRTFFRSFRRSG